jgi:hypothetical protein
VSAKASASKVGIGRACRLEQRYNIQPIGVADAASLKADS